MSILLSLGPVRSSVSFLNTRPLSGLMSPSLSYPEPRSPYTCYVFVFRRMKVVASKKSPRTLPEIPKYKDIRGVP